MMFHLDQGEGTGYNLNIPVPKETDEAAYTVALEQALQRISDYHSDYLIVSLGGKKISDHFGVIFVSLDKN